MIALCPIYDSLVSHLWCIRNCRRRPPPRSAPSRWTRRPSTSTGSTTSRPPRWVHPVWCRVGAVGRAKAPLHQGCNAFQNYVGLLTYFKDVCFIAYYEKGKCDIEKGCQKEIWRCREVSILELLRLDFLCRVAEKSAFIAGATFPKKNH